MSSVNLTTNSLLSTYRAPNCDDNIESLVSLVKARNDSLALRTLQAALTHISSNFPTYRNSYHLPDPIKTSLVDLKIFEGVQELLNTLRSLSKEKQDNSLVKLNLALENLNYIKQQAGYMIHSCNEQVEALVSTALKSEDPEAITKLKSALADINATLSSSPDTYVLPTTIRVGLEDSKIYEGVQELVERLQGKSELFPIPVYRIDGSGEAGIAISVEDQRAIRSETIQAVSIKIKTTIEELSREREVQTEEETNRKIAKQTERANFEELNRLYNTEEGAIELVSRDGMQLEKVHPIFKNNKRVVLAAVEQIPGALKFAHSRLQNDNEVVFTALRHPDGDHAIEFASKVFRENRERLLQAIRANEMAIGFGSDELVEDLEFLKAAIRANPAVFQLLDISLRNDPEMVLLALRYGGEDILMMVGEEQQDLAREYLQISRDGLALQFASAQLQDNDEFVRAAVLQNGFALQFASARLQDNDEIVKAAVMKNGLALEFASARLQDHYEIVRAAVLQNGLALQFASVRLKNHDLIVREAIYKNALAIQFASARLRDDDMMLFSAVCINGLALQFASARLQDNDMIVHEAVQQNGLALQFASERMRNNWTFVYLAVKKNGRDVLPHVSAELKPIAEAWIAYTQELAPLDQIPKEIRDDYRFQNNNKRFKNETRGI